MTSTFVRVTAASRQNAELRDAAHELMNASDYLTEQVQRFTVNGDRVFMDQYFTEAFESKRREEAIAKMNVDSKTEAALAKLQEAMDGSVKLMDQEYYAMRLVVEAKGYDGYPEVLDSIELSAEDASRSPYEKIRLANELVLNDEYYEQKDRIRQSMQECLAEIDIMAGDSVERELDVLDRQIMIAQIAIVVQAVFIFFVMWLTMRLAINPVLNAIDRVKEGSPIPEAGSSEFRYLVKAYNKMYEKNKISLERLSFKAYHDELTGAYNRAGYDYFMSNMDLETTYMMLFDLDNFKGINDTYGHETGDKVLKKIADTLKGTFREVDCVCRIGGDEFVVFMVHSDGLQRRLIESKLEQISLALGNTDDGLPPISTSVGIVNGRDAADTTDLFEKADEAMYKSKMQGKKTYTFYKES